MPMCTVVGLAKYWWEVKFCGHLPAVSLCKVSLYNKILNSTVIVVGEKLVPQSPYFTTLH